MCLICNTGVPVCNLVGGCSIQMIDYIKIVSMTGGASLGVALTTIQAKRNSQNNKSNEKRN